MKDLDYTRAAEMGSETALDDLQYAGSYRSENPFPDTFDWMEPRNEWQAAYEATVERERGFERFKAVMNELAECSRLGDTAVEIVLPRVVA